MIKTLHVARVGGLDVFLDWSLLIIFLLVTLSLGAGLFPEWHPQWGPLATWATAGAAAACLLVSVLLHELSHAFVGRARGIEISRITLFVFGGMAHMEQEPDEWRSELWMAIVGPVVSLLLGVMFIAIATLGVDTSTLSGDDPTAFMRQFGPLDTLLLWLGPVNIILAVFNIVPAFPLDGGRVLRALLWGLTGDLTRATRWASIGGQAFAWLLIAAGIMMAFGVRIPLLGTGFVGGLWAALIGWFLHNAAVASYHQLRLQESLRGVLTEQLMETGMASVPEDMTIQTLVDDHILGGQQRFFPVVRDDHLTGLVCIDDLRKARREAWQTTSIADVMTPVSRLATLAADDEANEALRILSRRRINQVPVVDRDGKLRGVVTRQGMLNWLWLAGQDAVGAGDTLHRDGVHPEGSRGPRDPTTASR
jgi:Zn-dependent protease/CBS domain-containing protein